MDKDIRRRDFHRRLLVAGALAAAALVPTVAGLDSRASAHPLADRAPTRTTDTALSPTVVNPFGVFGGKLTKYAAQVGALGASRTVVPVDWRSVQPVPPSHDGSPVDSDYKFSSLDKQVRAFGAKGIQVEFRLFTCAVNADGTDFWATLPEPQYVRGSRDSGNCTTMPAKDSQMLYWLVYNIVKHYSVGPYPVTYIAMENEINDHTQWPGVSGATACTSISCPMFDAYIQVLQTARAAADAASPDAVVLDSGLGSRMYGYGYARMNYEADVSRSGFSSAVLVKWASYLNDFLAYRRTPDNRSPSLWLDVTAPTDQLLQQFNALVYAPFDPDASPAQIIDTGDRAYYLFTHMFANAARLDAVQIHAYDQVDDFPAFLVYIQAQLRASDPAGRPLMCWECGLVAPMTSGQPSRIATFDPNGEAAILVKREVDALGAGATQVLHLPLEWDSPPPARKPAYGLPLLCGGNGTKYEPVMCPNNTLAPTTMGAAYSVLTHSLSTSTDPTPVTNFGAAVFGYEFTVPTGRLAVLWSVGTTSADPVVIDTAALGSVTGVSDLFGTPTSQNPAAYPLTSSPVYIHLS